ncbi:sulfite exporter TauE/SafE family protein [Candidatus Giovannonibacteria bacterium]|nr:sulfite exporter TauE/SafE family protein [Candidatus Giovannonibacteria bacterium]
MEFSLIIPAFIAGILTFLAPCTLPLVPGYLGFISGVSANDLQDPNKAKIVRGKIFFNGVFYVIGFSLVFIILGSLFGLGGAALFKYRIWLSRIGGIFVIFFGLFMTGILKLPFLNFEKHLGGIKALKPGNPTSSLIFGATFAFGWTPCVGPILGSILTLAAASATVGQGAFLLSVFSLGLAVPFLIIAAGIGSASSYISKLNKYLNVVSIIGGLFLIFLGILLFTNKLGVWIAYFYQWFDFTNYERLLDYL